MRIDLRKELNHWQMILSYCEHAHDSDWDEYDSETLSLMEVVQKSEVLIGKKIKPSLAVALRRNAEKRLAISVGRQNWYWARHRGLTEQNIHHSSTINWIKKSRLLKAKAVYRVTQLTMELLKGTDYIETGDRPHIYEWVQYV